MKSLTASLLVAASAIGTVSASAGLHHRGGAHHHSHAHPLAQRDKGCPAGAVLTTYLSTITFSPPVAAISEYAAAPAPSTQDSLTTTVTITSTSTSTKHVTVTVPPTTTAATVSVPVPVATGTPVPPAESSPADTPAVPPAASLPPASSAPSTFSINPAVSVAPVEPPTSVPGPASATAAAAPAEPSATNAIIISAEGTSSESGVHATYYTEDGVAQGHCSFTGYTLPAGIFGTALSVQSWDTASQCGACVEVTNPSSGAKVKAMIVDSCPGCPSGGLDLFESTFSQIASTAAGVLSVDWQLVDCALSTPIQVVFKDGSDADWFSLQLRNHNKPIGKVEVSAAGDSDSERNWQALARTEDNYFPKAGGVGSSMVDVRVTDVTGQSLTLSGVAVGSGVTTGSSNF